MSVIITMDSPGDLPKELIEENGIIITPLSILLGENSYLDGVEVEPNDLYDHVKKGGAFPKTAAVPPDTYYNTFKKIRDNKNEVVHIGLSSAISSTYQNAVLASRRLEGVYPVDSKSLCTAMGLLALKACDFRAKGMDAKKIATRVSKLVPKVSTTFLLRDLDFMNKGGRCSSLTRFGANMLNLKISITQNPETGELGVGKKYRGKIEVAYKQYINDCLSDINKIDTSRIVIADSGDVPPETLSYAEGLIESKGIFKEIIKAKAGCTISSHCGPGTIAIFYIKK